MADIELLELPALPEKEADELGENWTALQIEEYATLYARINVEHHTAKLRAEIKALKHDLDQYRDAALKEHEHAERLADALREIRRRTSQRNIYLIAHEALRVHAPSEGESQ